MKKIVQFIVLPIICLLLGVALAGVYNLTKPIIEEVDKQTANLARKEVLPAADDFTQINKEFSQELGIVDVYKANNGEGLAVKTAVSGYGGEITIMVGLDKDLKITGVKLLTHGETPGLGAKTAEPEFLNQFKGKGGTITAVKGEATGEDKISTVSSATISSKAVTLGINNALTAGEQVKGEM